MIRLKQKKV